MRNLIGIAGLSREQIERLLDRAESLALCEDNRSPVAAVFAGAVRKWGRPAVEVEQALAIDQRDTQLFWLSCVDQHSFHCQKSWAARLSMSADIRSGLGPTAIGAVLGRRDAITNPCPAEAGPGHLPRRAGCRGKGLGMGLGAALRRFERRKKSLSC